MIFLLMSVLYDTNATFLLTGILLIIDGFSFISPLYIEVILKVHSISEIQRSAFISHIAWLRFYLLNCALSREYLKIIL